MNGTVDTNQAFGEERLGAREAAALLEQSEQSARRAFDPSAPPALSWMGAAIFLVVYGSIYMAARGEHPYVGPQGPWLVVVPIGILISIGVNIGRYDRMKRAMNGATLRRTRATAAAVAAGLVAIYALDAALANAGAGKNIIYGVFDASAPLIVLASVGAACAAWREDWIDLGVSIAIVLVAAGAGFAGPAGAWGVIAIGGCLACVGRGIAGSQHRRVAIEQGGLERG